MAPWLWDVSVTTWIRERSDHREGRGECMVWYVAKGSRGKVNLEMDVEA